MEKETYVCVIGIESLDEVITYGLTGEFDCYREGTEVNFEKGVKVRLKLSNRCVYEEVGELLKVRGYISPKNIELVDIKG